MSYLTENVWVIDPLLIKDEMEECFAALLTDGAIKPVEPDDVMNAAHKLVHPMYDNAADCDKFWCEPFRALKVLKKGVGGDDETS